ncbi:hypothetical protein D3C72_2231550 [compost metagenome]
MVGDQGTGGLGEAAHHHALDGAHVNRLVERLAHAHILERVLALDAGMLQLIAVLVHPQEHGAICRRFKHLQIGRLLDALQIVHARVDDEIDFARQQRCRARGI